jgi:hypothetical protein
MSGGLALAALDPGRAKCGLALSPDGSRLQALWIGSPAAALQQLLAWHACQPLQGVVVGCGTGSAGWPERLQRHLPGVAIWPRPEHGSTLQARGRYWQLWPPRGWQRWLPAGLRQPPGPLDDLAALVLLEAHLGTTLRSEGFQKEARTVNR